MDQLSQHCDFVRLSLKTTALQFSIFSLVTLTVTRIPCQLHVYCVDKKRLMCQLQNAYRVNNSIEKLQHAHRASTVLSVPCKE